MSYNEDTQPNEVRHSRKGNSAVPTVRSSQSFTGLRGRGRGHAQGRGSHHSRGGHGSPYVHPSPRGRDWSLRPASRAERPLGRTHDGLAPKRIPRWGENRGSVPVPERPPKRPRSEYSDCPDTKSDPSLTPLLVEPSADAGPSQCERLGKMSLVEIPESHGEPPDPSHSNHGRRLHPSDAIHPSLTITPSGPQVSSHTISPSSSRRSLGHHGHTMHRSESNVLLYGSRSALRTPTFPMDLTLKEEHPLSGVLQTITASSLPIRTPTGSLPSETTIQPAPAPIPPVEIPPASSHGGVTEVVPPALTHAPRFRSGTLRIELPPHVRPLDPRHFLCGQPQVQQDADTPQDRAANASLTHKGDSRPQQSVLMQPTPSVHANRPRVEDETKVPEVSAAPTDPTSGYFQRVEQVQMRREPHDKPRRLLALPSGAMLSVTTRGSLDLVAQDPLRCTALRTSAFGDSARQLIEDACILLGTHKPAIIVGRTGNSQQLSLVRIKEAKVRDLGTFDRPSPADRKGGVSAVCAMMQPGSFAVGGYDHIVNLWSLPEERDAPPVRSAPLAARHTSAIHSLLPVRDTSHKLLIGGADCALSVYDLSSERTVNTLKLSNPIYHLHPVASPHCVLVELAHREFQFEIRDRRLVPQQSAVRFGYPNTKVHGRYTKGAVDSHIFACGGTEDGCVRLWDMRKSSNILQTIPCLPGKKVVQVHISSSRIVACSEDYHLAILNSESA